MKKKMKLPQRILSFFVLVCMVAAMIPAISLPISAAVGDTFTERITIGGNEYNCPYKVLTDNGDNTGTVQIGDGENTCVDSGEIGTDGAITLPTTVTNNGITYTVTKIGDYAFYGLPRITDTGLGTNSTVTSLGDHCFDYCTLLTNTGLGTNSTVTSLGESCFYKCTSLTDTGLGTNATVTTLGYNCFHGCTSLANTGLGTNSTLTLLGNDCFNSCTSLTDTGLGTNSTVTSLGNSCFRKCTSLTNTGLGTNSTVTSLGDLCFANCTSLTDTGLGTNMTVTTLGQFSFSDCIALTDTGLATNTTVTLINMQCFVSCTSLVNAAMPSSLISLARNIFTDSNSLKTICFYGNLPTTLNATWLAEAPSNVTIYYLAENTGWKADSAAQIRDGDTILALSTIKVDGGTSSGKSTNYWCTLDGTASNNRHVEGETVTITATDEKHFDHWEIVSGTGAIADASSATTTFTFNDDNVELKAYSISAPNTGDNEQLILLCTLLTISITGFIAVEMIVKRKRITSN